MFGIPQDFSNVEKPAPSLAPMLIICGPIVACGLSVNRYVNVERGTIRAMGLTGSDEMGFHGYPLTGMRYPYCTTVLVKYVVLSCMGVYGKYGAMGVIVSRGSI